MCNTNILYTIFLLAGIVLYCNGQKKVKECKDPKFLKDVDFDKMSGDWYLHKASPNDRGQHTKCDKIHFGEYESPRWPSNSTYYDKDLKKEKSNTNNHQVFYGDGNGISDYGRVQWYLLGTDYDKYAVFYRCMSFGQTYEKAEVLLRQKSEKDSVHEKAKKILEDNNISFDELRTVNQENC